MKITLASGSPRRRELLEMLGADFEVLPAKGEESAEPGLSPENTVKSLAAAKAEEVLSLVPGGLVLAADTIVELDGEILGKPKDGEDAKAMLRRLSGREHRVYTGVAVLCGKDRIIETEETKVFFRVLSESEIAAYAATGEPLDKAGAYGAQGIASLFVERIDGDFFNVMGLPICRVGRMLSKIGCELI